MPKGYKNPGIIAAEIKMSRTVHFGAFLIVEGVNDQRFWTPRKHKTCEVIDGEGKLNVIGCVERLDQASIGGVLGVVDSDFDALEGKKYVSKNLLSTDAHDLECMLCRSSSLDTVLVEYGDKPKLTRFEQSAKLDVRTALLERAVLIGKIRWAGVRLGLTLRKPRAARFVDESSWMIDRNALIASVSSSSDNRMLLENQVKALPNVDPWHIARGRDLIEILRIGLKKILGNIRSSIGTKEISRVLRASMPLDELKATRLGSKIILWEAKNPSYVVFSA